MKACIEVPALGRGMLVLALTAAVVRALPGPGMQAPGTDGFEALRGVLQRRSPADARTPAELVAGLAALGAPAVPSLYELVTGQALEGLIGGAWEPSAWLCKPDEIPALAAQALERTPSAAVITHLAHVLDGEPTLQERLIVLRILGAQGSAEGLDLVLRDAAELGELELAGPSVQWDLRASLSAILRRDRSSWSALEKRLAGLEPVAAEVLVAAIGESGEPRGMELLARLFERGQPAPELVIEAMAELERARPWALAGRTFQYASVWLSSMEPAERARAARLAGRLHALPSVPALIELTTDGDALVRRCAAQALEALASHPLGSDAGELEAWHEREQAWREERWEPLLETLTAPQGGVANEALRELLQHPLYRHEVASALAGSLLRQARAAALVACAELQNLGSPWALPGLVEALEQGPAQLSAAAWRTLRALTGEERGSSIDRWRELIDS